jgi:protein-disulfide isomerase
VTAAATRRSLLVGAALAVALGGRARAAITDPQPDDMALGRPRAPVTVIEYASVGCPHCAKWANEVFPQFKKRFIDTGKVRFVLREAITGQPMLATAGFMLARCAPASKYFDVVDGVFARQADIFDGKVTAAAALGQVAAAVGMSDAAFHACIDNQAGLDALNARNQRHAAQDGVDSTPTFFVNGKRLDGEQTLPELAAAIAAARRRRR